MNALRELDRNSDGNQDKLEVPSKHRQISLGCRCTACIRQTALHYRFQQMMRSKLRSNYLGQHRDYFATPTPGVLECAFCA